MLKQVEALLAEGRAVGNKELAEYLEVRGYATAADWVYGHAIQPGEWSEAADGTWRSSKAWVDEYRATRYKRT